MKVTGYTLREVIKRWRNKRDILAKQFPETIWAFEGDRKQAPSEIAKQFLDADRAVARLEAAQEQYNIQVKGPNDEPLAVLIKQIGGWSRLESLWSKEATDKASDRYTYGRGGSDRVRAADAIVAKRQVGSDECRAAADSASKSAMQLRGEVAKLNTTEIDMNLASALFD